MTTAHERLAASVRRLIDATIRSEVDEAAIAAVTEKIDSATAQLSEALVPGSFGVRTGSDGQSIALGNVVIGLRNPVAPPLTIRHDADGTVHTEFTLGAAYEGPPGHVHGGVCALILDHVLGATARDVGDDLARAGRLDADHLAVGCADPLPVDEHGLCSHGLRGGCCACRCHVAHLVGWLGLIAGRSEAAGSVDDPRRQRDHGADGASTRRIRSLANGPETLRASAKDLAGYIGRAPHGLPWSASRLTADAVARRQYGPRCYGAGLDASVGSAEGGTLRPP